MVEQRAGTASSGGEAAEAAQTRTCNVVVEAGLVYIVDTAQEAGDVDYAAGGHVGDSALDSPVDSAVATFGLLRSRQTVLQLYFFSRTSSSARKWVFVVGVCRLFHLVHVF
jgi:hypothetical protein